MLWRFLGCSLALTTFCLWGCDRSGAGGDGVDGGIDGDAAGTDSAVDGAGVDGSASDATATPDGAWQDGALAHCSEVGGVCTDWMWDMCPVDTEPYGDDVSLDCNGHCCVEAPASDCSADPNYNCVLGHSCSGCWAPARSRSLSCENGRVCCVWVCE